MVNAQGDHNSYLNNILRRTVLRSVFLRSVSFIGLLRGGNFFFFDPDQPVIDLNWKIAHGVLCIADRLVTFGYSYDPSCFCGHVLELPSHLFFDCPQAQSVLSWLQSLMFSFSPLCPSLLCRHVLFGFSPDDLCHIPRIFVYVLCICKPFIWLARNNFCFCGLRPGASDRES